MKRAALSFLFLFLLAGHARLGAQGAESLDKIRLKDGRTVSGRIVEERAADLVMLVRGIRRSYDRAFISGVSYGVGGPPADAPGDTGYGGSADEAVPAPPERPDGALAAALASRYRVPVRDVLWVRAQGVSDADLPLVFLIAATAAVTPRQVLGLVRKGWTWAQIEDYFRTEPDAAAYEPDPWASYACYDPYFDVGLGWNGGWGYGYGYGPYGGRGWGGRWGGRGAWAGGRGNGGVRGAWSGATGGGRVPIGGSWSGAGRSAAVRGAGGASGWSGHR